MSKIFNGESSFLGVITGVELPDENPGGDLFMMSFVGVGPPKSFGSLNGPPFFLGVISIRSFIGVPTLGDWTGVVLFESPLRFTSSVLELSPVNDRVLSLCLSERRFARREFPGGESPNLGGVLHREMIP